jgi:hypothetical protein
MHLAMIENPIQPWINVLLLFLIELEHSKVIY